MDRVWFSISLSPLFAGNHINPVPYMTDDLYMIGMKLSTNIYFNEKSSLSRAFAEIKLHLKTGMDSTSIENFI